MLCCFLYVAGILHAIKLNRKPYTHTHTINIISGMEPLIENPLIENPIMEPSEALGINPIMEITPQQYTLVNIDEIDKIPDNYPEEFDTFCVENQLNPPKITTGNGKALSAMLISRYHYWDRNTCDEFVRKFSIKTKDSIQLFNKHNQWGIKTNSGVERGKLYIVYPYTLSNKHKMRKDFKYGGTEEEKNKEIDHIKSTIKADYIDVENSLWQLGHKNPDSEDNSTENLVLQPPIQGKYRDNYIFIDSLTKMPTPNKLQTMIEKNEIKFTVNQLRQYKSIFEKLLTNI